MWICHIFILKYIMSYYTLHYYINFCCCSCMAVSGVGPLKSWFSHTCTRKDVAVHGLGLPPSLQQ